MVPNLMTLPRELLKVKKNKNDNLKIIGKNYKVTRSSSPGRPEELQNDLKELQSHWEDPPAHSENRPRYPENYPDRLENFPGSRIIAISFRV